MMVMAVGFPVMKVFTIGVHSHQFCTDSGVTFQAQADLLNAPDCDTIIIAGGIGIRQPEIAEEISRRLFLQRAFENPTHGIRLHGLNGLAPTGLLDSREVTVHLAFCSRRSSAIPKLKVNHKRALVQDGPFYTSSGLGAAK